MPTKVQEAYRTSNRLDHTHTNQNQNKERMSKAAKEKDKVTQKGRPIRITMPGFSIRAFIHCWWKCKHVQSLYNQHSATSGRSQSTCFNIQLHHSSLAQPKGHFILLQKYWPNFFYCYSIHNSQKLKTAQMSHNG